MRKINGWNIIPIFIIATLLNLMSYWHGHSENGWGRAGLIYNIILGFAFAVAIEALKELEELHGYFTEDNLKKHSEHQKQFLKSLKK